MSYSNEYGYDLSAQSEHNDVPAGLNQQQSNASPPSANRQGRVDRLERLCRGHPSLPVQDKQSQGDNQTLMVDAQAAQDEPKELRLVEHSYTVDSDSAETMRLNAEEMPAHAQSDGSARETALTAQPDEFASSLQLEVAKVRAGRDCEPWTAD